METNGVPVITLSSGKEMPVLGMGTFESFGSKGSEREKLAYLKAIEVGYRYFDTGAAYGTEEVLGEAIAEALQLGLIKSRNELFISSMLWCTDAHADRVLLALQNSLRNLKLEYLDLYMLPFPASMKPAGEKITMVDFHYITEEDEIFAMDYKSVWAAMEECQNLGLTKSIGVSNFSSKKLQELMVNAKIPPAVNSVEMSPAFQQKNLREYCKANNILIIAISILGSTGTEWGSNAVMGSEVLKQIAMDRGKSTAQVSMRWVYEQGAILVVKSFSEKNMRANLKIFDRELTKEDCEKIGTRIPQCRTLKGDFMVSPNERKRYMETNGVPVITLSSGKEMPVLGMGTFESFGSKGSEREKLAYLKAIEVGYRYFDTGAAYGTEEVLGEAIAEALQLGLIKSRNELFISSMLWCTDAHADRVLLALQNSLRNLKLEYLDLYMLPFPASMKPAGEKITMVDFHDITEEDEIFAMDYKSVWAAMEECQNLGLTKSIGVSNFSSKKLQELMVNAKIPPAVNSVEMSPAFQQKNLREYCKANNILIIAISILGSTGTEWGSNAVMGSEVLKQIAMDRGKSTAQVSMRWVYEQGAILVVKSFSEKNMRANLKIFDRELTKEDCEKIGTRIPQCRTLKGDFMVSPNGPFKTLQDLWDD
ncbi:hypothetical protein MKW92_031817 [Papaver armeniacum]|nr:hypothetical protein MKW92_031817 [Papaver armeniacum]